MISSTIAKEVSASIPTSNLLNTNVRDVLVERNDRTNRTTTKRESAGGSREATASMRFGSEANIHENHVREPRPSRLRASRALILTQERNWEQETKQMQNGVRLLLLRPLRIGLSSTLGE